MEDTAAAATRILLSKNLIKSTDLREPELINIPPVAQPQDQTPTVWRHLDGIVPEVSK